VKFHFSDVTPVLPPSCSLFPKLQPDWTVYTLQETVTVHNTSYTTKLPPIPGTFCDYLTLETGTDKQSRHVSKQLPTMAV
jgi:hypothetical protein